MNLGNGVTLSVHCDRAAQPGEEEPDEVLPADRRFIRLCHLQARKRFGAAGKTILRNAHPLQQTHEEVGERFIALRVEREMVAVLEATAGEQHGEVVVRGGGVLPQPQWRATIFEFRSIARGGISG